MIFDQELKDLELKLKVPYPERTAFLVEVAANLNHSYTILRTEGYSEAEAKTKAVELLNLQEDDVESLNAVHESWTARIIGLLPNTAAQFIKDFSGMVPLVIFAFYTSKKATMIEFLREGGWPGVMSVLAIGGIGLFINLRILFKWFVIRDHSLESLKSFNSGPLYLAVAAFLIGLFSTAAGYRIVFAKWSEGGVSDAVIRAGLSEPLAGFMVATIVAGLIVLSYGWLASWRAQTISAQA